MRSISVTCGFLDCMVPCQIVSAKTSCAFDMAMPAFSSFAIVMRRFCGYNVSRNNEDEEVSLTRIRPASSSSLLRGGAHVELLR